MPEESPQERFDRLKKQLQDSILKDYPNPQRKGCPDQAVLHALAERPLDHSVEEDSHWLHVTHCSECYREFLDFNNAFRERARARRTQLRWAAFGAGVAVLAAVSAGIYDAEFARKRPQNAEPTWVKRTVDIQSMERSATHNQPNTPIFLQRQPQDLTVELPVGSKAGQYQFQIKKEDTPAISTEANAGIRNGTTAFTVRVDLRTLQPGRYSMVVRQIPFDWNYYPVVI